MAEHTKTPWAAIWGGRYIVPSDHAKRPPGMSVYDDDDKANYAQKICTLGDDRHGRGTAEANAAFIVRAVNCRDELVEALEFYANNQVYEPDSTGRVGDLTFVARNALAKARGETP